MSILQRLTCATTASSTIRRFICKTSEQYLRLPRLNVSTTPAILNYESNQKQYSIKETDWTVIYRLPMVRWASAFNRLKFYQGLLTVVVIPGTFILEISDLLPVGASSVAGAIGVSGIITLSLCSMFFKNLIGFIYINKETNKLRFAYVDYWGRRQDIIVHVSDVIPDGAQQNPTRMNFYQNISLQSKEKLNFKLLERYGIIVQPEIFRALFY